MNNLLTLAIIVLLAAPNLILVESTAAQTIPKPSVPEFSVKYIDNSFDVPPIYSKDQYTGNTIMTQSGYHVENKSVELTIKNQPLTIYKDTNGNTLNLYYNIQWKGHFGDYWINYNSSRSVLLVSSNQPSSVYTIALGNNSRYGANFVYSITDISKEGQIDLQIQAYYGYYVKIDENITDPAVLAFHHMEGFYYYSFVGQSSGWSNTQIINISNGSVSVLSSPNPTVVLTTTPVPSALPTSIPTPIPTTQSGDNVTLPQLGWAEVVVVTALGLVAVLVVVVVVLGRRIRRLEHKVAP